MVHFVLVAGLFLDEVLRVAVEVFARFAEKQIAFIGFIDELGAWRGAAAFSNPWASGNFHLLKRSSISTIECPILVQISYDPRFYRTQYSFIITILGIEGDLFPARNSAILKDS